MQVTHGRLVAIALGALLASPMASAQAQGNASHPEAAAPATAKASDAISARTTAQESRGATAATVAAASSGAWMPVSSTATATGGIGAAQAATGTALRSGNWWIDADRDGDGRLSATEAAANAGLNSRFAMIDADRDGFVTQDEYRGFFTANAAQGAQHAAAHSLVVTRDAWLRLDADADSRISLVEAMPDADLSGKFTTVDGNKDGFVTQDEYRAYAKANRP